MPFDAEGSVAVLDRPRLAGGFSPEPRVQPTPPPRRSLLKVARTVARGTYKYVVRPVMPWIFDWAVTRTVRAIRAARSQKAAGHIRHSTFRWRLARLLIASSKQHAFLDRAWISWLFRCVPRGLRQPLARRLLSLSPHYYVYQWTDRYPDECPRGEILRREHERNAASRAEICDKLVSRFLRPGMTVLDFGCGPGFLAREVSAHVAQVIAADVSRGVIACARQLNPADNLRYVANRMSDLSLLGDASVDLVYSFAVFQHLLKGQSFVYFQEFARILKPGGMGICHTILSDARPDAPAAACGWEDPQGPPPQVKLGAIRDVCVQLFTGRPRPQGWVDRRVDLRMVYFTAAEWKALLQRAGFKEVQVVPVSSITDLNDDIGNEHLVTFRK